LYVNYTHIKKILKTWQFILAKKQQGNLSLGDKLIILFSRSQLRKLVFLQGMIVLKYLGISWQNLHGMDYFT